MLDELRIETNLFEHKEVKPHFINPCCFGEDFAQWLADRVAPQVLGFEFSDPIQEDYGWGFWIEKEDERFWIALSYVGVGPTNEPAEWVVSVNDDPGLNLIKRLFHKPDSAGYHEIRDIIWRTIKSTPEIKVLN